MKEYVAKMDVIKLAKDIAVTIYDKHGDDYQYRHRCIDPQCVMEMEPADVVEIVRCKDCKYKRHDKERDIDYCCLYVGLGCVNGGNFCVYGERKDAVS